MYCSYFDLSPAPLQLVLLSCHYMIFFILENIFSVKNTHTMRKWKSSLSRQKVNEIAGHFAFEVEKVMEIVVLFLLKFQH